jgi:hypothetical protein
MPATKVNISTTSATVVAGKTGRKMLFIRNEGPNTAYLTEEASATVANSWPLKMGEVLPLARDGAGGFDPSLPVNAICNAAESAELRVWQSA